MGKSRLCKKGLHEWCFNRDHDECNCTCRCHAAKTKKWYMAVAPHQPGRFSGGARPCSCLYPSKAALKRHGNDLKAGWVIVVVELPKSVPKKGTT